MNIVITVIAAIVLIAGIVYTRGRQSPETQPQKRESIQAEEQKEATEEAEKQNEKEDSTTPQPFEIISPAPTPTPAIGVEYRSDLQYPGSRRISSSGNTSVYESETSSDAITDWYKQKIESLGMNTKSFVKTKTNDNVLNKLVGADGDREVRVEITKSAGSSTTTIKVTTT